MMLVAMQQTVNKTPSELHTKREVAKRLKVTTRTIDLWVAGKVIPSIKINNNSIRFNWSKVIEALENK